MAVKVREAIRILVEDGWCFVNQRGSHRHFKHPVKPGKVTISGSSNVDIPAGTWASICRQMGLKLKK